MGDATGVLDRFLDHLKGATRPGVTSSGWAYIDSPFLDRHNDHIRVWVSESEGEVLLSDRGETVRDLGRLISYERAVAIAARIARSTPHVKLDGHDLIAQVPLAAAGDALCMLLSAMKSLDGAAYGIRMVPVGA